MKKLINLIGIVLISMSYTAQGFVSLKGKQFRLNNEDFYPVTMNYKVDICRTSDAIPDFFIAPHHAYSDNWGFSHLDNTGISDATKSMDDIKLDFEVIKELGFNSVRIVGLGFNYFEENGIMSNLPQFTTLPSGGWGPQDYNNSNPVTNLNVQINEINYANMKAFIDTILSVAGEIDNTTTSPGPFKVQLLTGAKNCDLAEHESDYTSFLSEIANKFSKNTTLYSYDFFNEPEYNAKEYSKSEICEKVSNWHHAIKDHAPNHLTTIGLGTPTEVLAKGYDPGILNLDFLSFHLYLSTANNVEAHDGNNSNSPVDLVAGFNDVFNQMKWISETSKLPWIIGETALSGTDIYASDDPFPDHNAYYDGSEEDQKNFAKESLEWTRNLGGSGYSWWQYKEVSWRSDASPDLERQHYFGLITRHAAAGSDDDGIDCKKQAADEFLNFDPFDIQPTPQLDEYYWTNFQFNADNYTYEHEGRVVEALDNTKGIENAVILAQSGPSGDYKKYKTFSNTNGDFTIYSDKEIEQIKISAVGCSGIKMYSDSDFDDQGWLNMSELIPGSDFKLERFVPNSGVSNLDNITIPQGQSEYYEFYDAITASNFTIQANGNSGGSVIMKATNSITLKPGFVANKGSKYHGKIQQVFAGCGNISSWKSKQESYSEEQEEIGDQNALRIFPNPSNGQFTIENSANIEKIEVYNIVSDLILQKIPLSNSTTIDVTNNAKGVYLVKITTGGTLENRMIIYE